MRVTYALLLSTYKVMARDLSQPSKMTSILIICASVLLQPFNILRRWDSRRFTRV